MRTRVAGQPYPCRHVRRAASRAFPAVHPRENSFLCFLAETNGFYQILASPLVSLKILFSGRYVSGAAGAAGIVIPKRLRPNFRSDELSLPLGSGHKGASCRSSIFSVSTMSW
ncbi:hypothetical protein BOSE62_160491 [Bosea sp. 62]|nr:hypothetical protein BOSE21B_10019 [Bosea sp. 21B]CAD5259132.1 hypothetical protein BOSE7B_130004 [Bosea sp. 7B]CAD5268746.1 hypothetical protein BOSE46_150021 [Bosea sp. 46]VVT50496.1 hypothetical protein BOS5A_110019 [Bosea sp. EC-HK365B]VXB00654.1 hypothetical protein BOSE127_10190 [Bosea sp. 127]VXC02682.1 hypothetical protein BOSE62_160491 [Bosea sp. 62]VXC08845.1 hypothetical protein BOSE29B_20084 [Bosea sp. 29B]VXC69185.1 hypothetical protein BOSE125_40008 [Bosea sp. 125]